MQSLKMVTSIAPKRLEAQQEAISSWQKLGFEVISFNHPSEIEKVKPHFDGVIFLEAKSTAIELYNMDVPYPSIRELIKYVFNSGQVCWIANSDIILKISKVKIKLIEEAARHTMLFGNRIDVEGQKEEIYSGGFDYFVFSNYIEHLFTSRVQMCIGQPWWDYWMPITCIRKHVTPIKCEHKIAYHIKHHQEWDDDNNYFFAKILGKEIGIPDFDRSDLGKFGKSILNNINNNSKPLEIKRKR